MKEPIRLNEGKFCLNCELIFHGKICPQCAGHQDSWVWVASWLKSTMPRECEGRFTIVTSEEEYCGPPKFST